MSETFKWCQDKTRLASLDKQVFCVNRYGNKWWYFNGKYHREDGPAVEYANGDKFWYLNDILHRENGPAIEYSDGGKRWYLNGRHYSEPAYWKELGKRVTHLSGVWIEID